MIEEQGAKLERAEADRAARLDVIHAQGRQLEELNSEVRAQGEQIQALMAQLETVQRALQSIEQSRAYRVLRRLGGGNVAAEVGRGR